MDISAQFPIPNARIAISALQNEQKEHVFPLFLAWSFGKLNAVKFQI